MSCACMGPQNGEPLCPCRMRAAETYSVNVPLLTEPEVNVQRLEPDRIKPVLRSMADSRRAKYTGPIFRALHKERLIILYAKPLLLVQRCDSGGHRVGPRQLFVCWYDDELDHICVEPAPKWRMAKALAPGLYQTLMDALQVEQRNTIAEAATEAALKEHQRRNRPKMTRADYEAALKERRESREAHAMLLRTQGKTYRQVGEALGVSVERARQIVKRAQRVRESQERRNKFVRNSREVTA